jgi:GAF domain-containing protein
MTGSVALELYMVQYDHDGEPLPDVVPHHQRTTPLDVYEHGKAFPHVAVAAGRLGVRAVLSVPALWGGESIATLNVYSRTGPFDESAETVVAVLAAQVAIAVSRSPEFAGRPGPSIEQAHRAIPYFGG